MKNNGGHCGSKEISRGANINVPPAWWFSVVMKIDLLWLTLSTQHRLVNIVRTGARRSSNRLKFYWLKVICCICQPNKLECEMKHKTGVPSRMPAKNLEDRGPPRPPLRIATALEAFEIKTSFYKWLCRWVRLIATFMSSSNTQNVQQSFIQQLIPRFVSKDFYKAGCHWYNSEYQAQSSFKHAYQI